MSEYNPFSPEQDLTSLVVSLRYTQQYITALLLV